MTTAATLNRKIADAATLNRKIAERDQLAAEYRNKVNLAQLVFERLSRMEFSDPDFAGLYKHARTLTDESIHLHDRLLVLAVS